MSEDLTWPDPDSALFRKVDPQWSPEELLEQKGWFLLVEVLKILDPKTPDRYKKILGKRENLMSVGRDATRVIGLRMFGRQPWVDMAVFSKWFEAEEKERLKRTSHWRLQISP